MVFFMRKAHIRVAEPPDVQAAPAPGELKGRKLWIRDNLKKTYFLP